MRRARAKRRDEPDRFAADAALAQFGARHAAECQESWYDALFRTHPDDLSRIRRALEWKAANTPDAWSASGLAGEVRQRSGDWLDPITDWPEASETEQ